VTKFDRESRAERPAPLRKCPLCGATFSEDEQPCKGCPMQSGCSVVCCPACGYSFVAESQIVSAFKKLRKRRADR